MSQGYVALSDSTVLSTIDTVISQNLQDLWSHFSGTSAPTTPTPEQGMIWCDTTNDVLKVYSSGATWKTLLSTESTYGGLLPLSAGSSYPLTGHLYCGSKNLKNVADPEDDQDASTKAYVDQERDGHYHTGAGSDGEQITYTTGAVAPAGEASFHLLGANSSDALHIRRYNADYIGSVDVSTSWTQLITASVKMGTADESKIILYGFTAIVHHNGVSGCIPQWQVKKDSTVLTGTWSLGNYVIESGQSDYAAGVSYVYIDDQGTKTKDTTYTYSIEGKYSAAPSGTKKWDACWICVI